jgi:4-hydroxy-tetrahydrodipicolinate synthase
MQRSFDARGVMPACLLPFDSDLEIDEAAFRKHLRDVVSVDGISAITINCHSTEVATCSFDEQRRVLEIAADEVGDRIPIVAGVYTESSKEAAKIARMSQQGGASALLVFPPAGFSIGAHLRPEMTLQHYGHIADASDLPLIYFQFNEKSGLQVTLETIVRLADQIPTLRATKDFCNDPVFLEHTVRTLQGRSNPVHVLTTHTAWLMASLALGCNGVLSGSGSTVADLQVAMFRAIQAGDLTLAQRINDRMYPINRVFYAAPHLDMHNRMKEAQVLLGRLPSAVVRPPLQKLCHEEVARIRDAFVQAGYIEPRERLVRGVA